MKKLLLSTLLCVLIIGSAHAQFSFTATAANNAIAGLTVNSLNPLDKDTLSSHFNTNKALTTWTTAAITLQKATTQKGLQALIYSDNTTTTSVQSGNFKCAQYNSGGNPVHIANLTDLFTVMALSSGTPTPTNGSTSDLLINPAHCLFDFQGSTTNQVYAVYPGKYKHVEYGFYISLSGKSTNDDITFKVGTFDAGNTNKVAKYELTVYANTSSISSFSQIGQTTNDTYLVKRISDFYTTGSPEQTINLSTVTGKSAGFFSNKHVYIFFKTLGTSNAVDVNDGLPNTATNNVPDVYDPMIYFDDFYLTYQSPMFTLPITTATNSNYVNYNNGAPAIKATDAALTNPGTAKSISTGSSIPVTISLKSTNRVGTFTVTENLVHSTYFTYNSQYAFMSNDGNGNYNVPVAYSETINGTSSLWTLTIAAPPAGSVVNDDMQFTFNVNRPTDGTSNLRLEISNGSARFWYDFSFVASTPTDVHGNAISPIGISTSNSLISVINATENVEIYTVAGQKVKVLSVAEAAQGVAVNAGAYIVKHGSELRKVLVK